MLALAGVVWLAGLYLGFRSILAYENAPGLAAQPPQRLPSQSTGAASGQLTLVLMAHPRCPCTYATVDELAEIMARARQTLRARVYFYKPAGASDRWAQTDLWRAAAAIPGVELFADEGGRTAHRFGAATSGQAVLYGADGALLFSGGLTDSRGHAGESTGGRAVLALCAGKPGLASAGAPLRETPVYGCPLQDPDVSTVKEGATWKP